jgi:hypothetical protein
VIRGRLDEVARLVPHLVDGLPERFRPVGARRPLRELEAPADDPFALEEEDELVEPVDEQGLDAVGLPGEVVPLALLHRRDVADEVEQREAGRREQLGAVGGENDEADVSLVLERLPAQE